MSDLNHYLTFKLGDDIFGITVSHIREVLVVPYITHLPHVPKYYRGVFNLRGKAVPLIDLKEWFNQGTTDIMSSTAILVLENSANESEEKQLTGILVDEVNNVFPLQSNEIHEASQIGLSINSGYIQGIGKIDENFIIILNVLSLLKNEVHDSKDQILA